MNNRGFTALAAQFAANLTYEAIPAEVVALSKRSILDLLGVTLAGSKSEEGLKLLEYLDTCDEKESVSIIGSRYKASLDTATLINGLFSHALDFDDCNDSVHGHPSVALVPVLMSLCQLGKISGKEAITAYVAGFEIEAAIGKATGDSSYEKGFHTTATLGVFGAAVVAGKLLGLSERQFRLALGIAASMAAGLKQNFGTMTKPLHAGIACKNGILAAKLAKINYTANESIFEARQGYPNAYCKQGDFDFTGLGEKLGVEWDIIETGIILKKWPCCAETHRGIEAALKIAAAHRPEIQNIRSIKCLVQERVMNVCIYPRPKTALEAKFSQEYCAAQALIHGELSLSHFEDSAVTEPEISAFIEKATMEIDPEQRGRGDINDESTTIIVTMEDGTVYREKVQTPLGSKTRPLSDKELTEKFRDCAKATISDEAIEKIISIVSRFEEIEDISVLCELLAGN